MGYTDSTKPQYLYKSVLASVTVQGCASLSNCTRVHFTFYLSCNHYTSYEIYMTMHVYFRISSVRLATSNLTLHQNIDASLIKF
jgi:hypothetical protein